MTAKVSSILQPPLFINFPQIIKKFDGILSRGLCYGVGQRDGQMCIEAAICAALDLPHGDDPGCVAAAVRQYKIKLNDSRWSSPAARAAGLRNLGIAQIGSKGVVHDQEFVKRLTEKTIRVLIPALFRLPKYAKYPSMAVAARRCEQEGTKAAAADATGYASAVDAAAAAAYAAAAAAYAAAAAAYAADAAAAAAYAADAAAAAYAAYAADAAAAAYAAADHFLNLSASLALEVLIELKSPGCEWLEITK